MAYEKLVVHAIQREDVKTFPHRFRTFPSRAERDQVLSFLQQNDAPTASQMSPVVLTITVETDDIQQLQMELRAGD